MKRLCASVLSCLLSFAVHAEPTYTQKTIDTVYAQQRTFVTDLINHYRSRLAVVVPKHMVDKNTVEALDDLRKFVTQHPDALECVVDTFQICINEDCMNIPYHVDRCIGDYKKSSKALTLPDIATLQNKVHNLITSYFAFQLTLLGTLDYYAQQFVQRTNLDLYFGLIKPWIAFGAVYLTIHGSLKLLENALITQEAPGGGHASGDPKKIPLTAASSPIGFIAHTVKSFASSSLKEFDNAAAKLVASYILTPGIKTSLERAGKYLSERSSASYAQLISKPRKSGYRAKPVRDSFDSIQGYDDIKLYMMPVLDFCNNLEEYRAADLKIARGFIFEGPLTEGRKLGRALAGEMTKKLQSAGSCSQWLVYEIHGSSLIHRNLDSILEECLEFGPTVLIINNIDWIYTQKDVEPVVYADIINKLAKYLSQESTFPILICATSQDHTVIDPVMLETHKFEVVTLS